eukprot:TRINITY_DN22402_c0_g1_i1.p1 TRINITY_DN22402_c0_g1~~TRINITY_DN22402_c0_g1_i1.p1  ORF type:complete len:249 (-),score=106.32 TRINITY_DN22402_c0_g1_i1:133-879(-)
MKSFTGKKEKYWLRQMSRNVLTSGKSTTALSLNRSVGKSATPLKLVNLQKSARADTQASTREKALLQQNVELKRKNNELVRVLKKSKELIRSEVGKYKAENGVMKKFAEAAWAWAEPNLEEKLKEEVRPILVKTAKTNSIATNSTDHCSGENLKDDSNHKCKLSQRAFKASLLQKLNDTKLENEKLSRYLYFLGRRSERQEALVVDSENVESDDEVVCRWTREENGVRNEIPVAVPTFLKSLRLANKY